MTPPLTPEQEIRSALDERFNCYADLIAAGFQPTLATSIMSGCDWRRGEADIAIETSGFGLLHEQIATVLEIAGRNGARGFLDPSDGQLSVVWPSTLVPDPEPTDAQQHKTKARGRAKVKS